MSEQKRTGSEVICTLSHELSGRRQFVMQFAVPKDATVGEKNALLDEMRILGERQMAFGQLSNDEQELKRFLKDAEETRARMGDIEATARMAYQINGGGKRGPSK